MTRQIQHQLIRRSLVALGIILFAFSALPVSADVVKLRHLRTDDEGNFTVLFSTLDNNRDPISDRRQIPTSGISMSGGEDAANLDEMELEERVFAEPVFHNSDFGNVSNVKAKDRQR